MKAVVGNNVLYIGEQWQKRPFAEESSSTSYVLKRKNCSVISQVYLGRYTAYMKTNFLLPSFGVLVSFP